MANRLAVLTLYRSILRTHARCLPPEMRELGDTYVKSEFQLHKSVKDEAQLERFLKEWRAYVSGIQQTARAVESKSAGILENEDEGNSSLLYKFGKALPTDIEINEEQQNKLKSLRDEVSNAYKP